MRADRLVSILMLLQSRGQITAQELAEALEVSVRTIYRDMEALSTAGIPVYTERGPSGGCRLVENYRTELTGLTQEEASALLVLMAPGPLDGLPVGQKLKSTLRKLYAALPSYPNNQGQSSARIYLDWTWWGQPQNQSPKVEDLYQAVIQNRRVKIAYYLWNGLHIEQSVEPLGLVTRGGMWHLVCQANSKIRSHKLSQLEKIEILNEIFDYPEDFDLQTYWRNTISSIERENLDYQVVLNCTPAKAAELPRLIDSPRRISPAQEQPDGSVNIEILFESQHAARQRLLSLGSTVKVLFPLALRVSLIDYAQQILSVYESS
jgi:predicted DNA-binding transcriptional regulator YafY